MGCKIDLAESFEKYFHANEGFALRSERFYEMFNGQYSEGALAEFTRVWLEAAFKEGAKAMAYDTLDALGDYGTAVAGIEERRYNASEAFDTAHANLAIYYYDIFKEDW